LVDGGKHITVGSDNVPYLNWWNGRAKLNANWDDNANPNFRALVCDSLSKILWQIVLGGLNLAVKHFAFFGLDQF